MAHYQKISPTRLVDVTRSIHGDLSGNSWTTTVRARDADFSTDNGTIDVNVVTSDTKQTVIIRGNRYQILVADAWDDQ